MSRADLGLIGFLALGLGLSPAVRAVDACPPRLMAELWPEPGLDLAGGDASVLLCPRRHVEARLGGTYYQDRGQRFAGATGSMRLRVGDRVAPFAGLGLLAGVGERQVSQEPGPEGDGSRTVEDSSLYLFPEAGVALKLPWLSIQFSLRRYYGTELTGRQIYSLGIAVPLD